MKKIASLLIIILIGVAVGADAAAKPRKFYLTVNEFDGNEALTACATGYHIASLWEILDVSHLRYDTTLGFRLDDSGFGPPIAYPGWIRTGYQSTSTADQPGTANCSAWMSDSDIHFGSTVHLHTSWTDPGSEISPWFADSITCQFRPKVWCVED